MHRENGCTCPPRGRVMLGLSALIAGGMIVTMGTGQGTAVGKEVVASPAAPSAATTEWTAEGPSLEQMVNDGLGLAASEVVTLDLDLTPGLPLTTVVPLGGVDYTVQLAPISVRSEDYTLVVHDNDGLHEAEPGVIRTLAGTLVENTDVTVAGSMMIDGLYASFVFPGGDRYFLEPVADIVGLEGSYAVYHGDDVFSSGGTCGVPMGKFGEDLAPFTPDPDPLFAAGGQVYFCAELVADADFQFYLFHGANVPEVEARIELVINTVNQQYQNEVDISHIITNITVRTTSESNPYTTNDPDSLLNQVRSWWQSNGGGIPRDVVHLFTGRNLSGTVIGIAFISAVCNFNLEYSLVQSDCCGAFACATDLSAHELGHNWGAGHCCPGTTMNSGLQCANTFGQTSINQITNYRNNIGACLEGCNGTNLPPANDSCGSAMDVGDGTINFSNMDATSDGPDDNCDGTIVDDLWFDYVAACNGTATVSTCFSNFDTNLIVYDGQNCSTFDVVACNDNSTESCGPGALQSEVSFNVIQGQHYLIRIGGGPTGPQNGNNGQLTISCVEFATGACCVDDTCFSISEMNCMASGGTYFGDGSPCTPNPCAPPVGACCIGESCISTTADQCTTFGGSYEGDNVPCVPSPCAPPITGACCLDGACSVSTQTACESAGGTYQGDGTDCGTVVCETFCPADITGPTPGQPDGNVDSLDFLLLIGQWGSPCVGTCEADITGPTPGQPDGNVDSLDFLFLISQWGSPASCP